MLFVLRPRREACRDTPHPKPQESAHATCTYGQLQQRPRAMITDRLGKPSEVCAQSGILAGDVRGHMSELF